MITCIDCGTEVEGHPTRKRCADCARVASATQSRERKAKMRAERGAPRIDCIDCGIDVERTGNGQKRCAACAEDANRESRRKSLAARRKITEPWRGLVTCADCSKVVKRRGGLHKRCDGCAAVHNQKREEARARERYAQRTSEDRELARLRAQDYYYKNRDAINEASRHRYAENRPRVLEQCAEYRAKNQDAIAERNAAYRAKNRDHFAAKSRRWYRENPALVRRQRAKARVRDTSIESSRGDSRWTPDEDAVLLSWTTGARELASVLGRSHAAVTHRRRRLRATESPQ